MRKSIRILTVGPDRESPWVQFRVHPVGDQPKALKMGVDVGHDAGR